MRSLREWIRTKRIHAGLSDKDLTALSRACLAVHNAMVADGTEEEWSGLEFYRERIDELYAICRERCSAPMEVVRRIPLVCTLYQLILNVLLRPVDSGQLNECDEMAYGVITDYLRETDAGRLKETPDSVFWVCMLVTDLLYYVDEEEREQEEMMVYFRGKLAQWVEELGESDHWKGLPEREALQRVTILERYAGMFLKHEYDEEAERLEGYYGKTDLDGVFDKMQF